MKKLHIINLEKMGGVERLFIQYINDFSDYSDDVICISDSIDTEIRRCIPDQKIIIANRFFNKIPLKMPQFLRKYALQKRVNTSEAEVIIVWDLIPRLITKPEGVKLVYYDHGSSWRYPQNLKTHSFMAMLDGVISASCASRRVMEQRFKLACPHYVVINRIRAPEGVVTRPRRLGNTLWLGTASRQVSLKGISVALLMMQELISRGHPAGLEIAGKGPDRDTFIALAEKLHIMDYVTFSGFQQDMSPFFNRIDIYISTPVTEPFGLSCMEALYHGVPVIFPLIDGQPEVIKQETCGIGLIPTVTIDQHRILSGIQVDFPWKVYDPVTDKMAEPNLLSHLACADAIETMLQSDTYDMLSDNAKFYSANNFNYNKFKIDFEYSLMSIMDM